MRLLNKLFNLLDFGQVNESTFGDFDINDSDTSASSIYRRCSKCGQNVMDDEYAEYNQMCWSCYEEDYDYCLECGCYYPRTGAPMCPECENNMDYDQIFKEITESYTHEDESYYGINSQEICEAKETDEDPWDLGDDEDKWEQFIGTMEKLEEKMND